MARFKNAISKVGCHGRLESDAADEEEEIRVESRKVTVVDSSLS
jgi:hypothetical protein